MESCVESLLGWQSRLVESELRAGKRADVELPGVLALHHHCPGSGAELNRYLPGSREPTTYGPPKNTTDKGRTGDTCSASELLRHMEPETAFEPSSTRLDAITPSCDPSKWVDDQDRQG